jgi:NAD(P)-dependent dehydrogenase (short-subunit alcohol dehydrogenase family)
MTEREFPDGCAVVVGGSGGLGSAISLLLAAHGTAVVVTYRNSREAADQVVAEAATLGPGAHTASCDVCDIKSVESVFLDATDRYGRVHTVITTPGLAYVTRPLLDTQFDDFRAMIDVDVFGFLNVMRSAIPALRAGGSGAIVAITGSAARRSYPGMTIAGTPKIALAALCTQIALEEGVHGIRANTIGPGVIDAGMARSMMNAETKPFLDQAVAMTPLRRAGTADEVAEATVFLASVRASFITGQHLMVDGGLSAG